jgi:hypothetical protein
MLSNLYSLPKVTCLLPRTVPCTAELIFRPHFKACDDAKANSCGTILGWVGFSLDVTSYKCIYIYIYVPYIYIYSTHNTIVVGLLAKLWDLIMQSFIIVTAPPRDSSICLKSWKMWARRGHSSNPFWLRRWPSLGSEGHEGLRMERHCLAFLE